MNAGRPRSQLIDRHDSARYALDRAGGLRRYLVVEAWRALARWTRRR